jgi:hypothetical protein
LATVLVHKHRGCLVGILRAFLHEPVNPQSGMAQAVDELGEQAVRAGVVRMDDCSNRQDVCRAIASVSGLDPLWESCDICRFLWRSERIAKTVVAAGRGSESRHATDTLCQSQYSELYDAIMQKLANS